LKNTIKKNPKTENLNKSQYKRCFSSLHTRTHAQASSQVRMSIRTDASEFLDRLFVILRMGVTVGIVEGMDDEDYESGESFFRLFADRQFRLLNGEVYCKGGSVMHPAPATDEDGWEVEPVDECFLEDVFSDGNVHTVYAVVVGQVVQLWTHDHGWDNSKKFLNTVALSKMAETVEHADEKQDENIKPLMFLAAEAVRNHRGTLALREYEHVMDYETRNHVFKSPSWWVPL